MTNTPMVSIIIPTFNRAALLKQSIESVLLQSNQEFEIIVVDDGSTDDSAGIVEQIKSQHSTKACRIRYLYQKNQGKSAALNYGLLQVRGEWIAFLDSDDRWLPDVLTSQLGALKVFAPTAGVCFTDATFSNNPNLRMTALEEAGKLFDEKVGMIEDPVRYILRAPHGIYLQTALARADLVKAVGPFDPALRVSQDTDFLFRLALKTQFCFINKPLVEIDRTVSRQDGLSELFRSAAIRVEERIHMYEQWLKLTASAPGDIRESICRQMGGIYSEQANMHLLNDNVSAAIESMSRSLALRPSAQAWTKYRLLRLAPSILRMGIGTRTRFSKPHPLSA